MENESINQTSPQYCHVRSRQLEGSFPGDAMDGVYPVSAARVNRGWGSVLESDWPYACSPDNWPPPEPTGLDKKAKSRRCHHYQRVRSASECCELLGHGIPVPAAFEITKDWFSAKNGTIEMPSEDAISVGGHQVCIVGFDLFHQLFRFVNSWGEDWGHSGFGYMPFDYFDKFLLSSWSIQMPGVFPKHFCTKNLEQLVWGMPDFLGHSTHGGDLIHGREIFDGNQNQRIAWLFALHRDGFLDVEEFFVMPQYRKQGYGNQLLDMLYELRDTAERPIRIWITHADWTEDNYEFLSKFSDKLGLSLFESFYKWSPGVIAAEPPPNEKNNHTGKSEPVSSWSDVSQKSSFKLTSFFPTGKPKG